jgi:ankyrin repeat protein
MIEASQRGDITALKESITSFKLFDKIFDTDEKGYTAAHWAVYFDESECVELLLSSFPTMFYHQSSRNLTPLHIGCLNNSVRSIRIISHNDVFTKIIHLKTQWGETALHLSAATGNVVITDLILKAGADLDIVDNWGRNPVDVAIEHGEKSLIEYFKLNYPNLVSNYHSNLTRNDGYPLKPIDILEDLQQELKQSKLFDRRECLDPNSNENLSAPINTVIPLTPQVASIVTNMTSRAIVSAPNRQPLSKMVEYPGDPELLTLSLSNPEVDPNGKDMFGWTALHKFASWDKVDLVEILLSKSRDYIDINMCAGPNKFTPLHVAIDMGATRTAHYLLHHEDINISIVDKNGNTALSLAKIKSLDAIVGIIENMTST